MNGTAPYASEREDRMKGISPPLSEKKVVSSTLVFIPFLLNSLTLHTSQLSPSAHRNVTMSATANTAYLDSIKGEHGSHGMWFWRITWTHSGTRYHAKMDEDRVTRELWNNIRANHVPRPGDVTVTWAADKEWPVPGSATWVRECKVQVRDALQ